MFIADEVQPGFGRTGAAMWGFQRHGLVPDIVTRQADGQWSSDRRHGRRGRRSSKAFGERLRYFNTFGGNPVSAAVGMAVLDVIEGEGLMANAAKTGAYLRDEIVELAKIYPIIGDIRAAGLFMGVEMVRDPITRAPAPKRRRGS